MLYTHTCIKFVYTGTRVLPNTFVTGAAELYIIKTTSARFRKNILFFFIFFLPIL